MRFHSNIVTALLCTALVSQAFALTCDPVSTTDVLPPANSVAVAALNATGNRLWDCANGKLADPKQIAGTANFTGTFEPSPGAEETPVTGGFVYVDKVARFTLVSEGGTSYEFDLDATPSLQNVTGTLANARWTVNWLDNPPAGLSGLQAYLTRTNSTGGVTPTRCANAAAKTVEVPYTTTYTMYACTDGSATPTSSATAATAATAVILMVLALFA